MNLSVVTQGFGVGISLIIAIGAQNSYVLKNGILKKHVFVTALLCSFLDMILITAGTLGLSSIIDGNKTLMLLSTSFGILFLTYYGVSSIIKAIKSNEILDVENDKTNDSLKKTIVTILALTLLNPHVYLDTVILIGSIGSKFANHQQIDFIIGACSASFIWFFGLAYGARILIPIFKKEITWKILDIVIGLVMIRIASKLVFFAIDNNLLI